jgi:hypothetical protein
VTEKLRDEHPFCGVHARRDALRELKRAVVRIGTNGTRMGFLLAKRLFAAIPGLREA